MSLEDLAGQFLVEDSMGSERLQRLIEKLLPYCVVHKNGQVDITATNFSGKELVKLVLAARLVASKLKDSPVNEEVTLEEISGQTGLPRNQATARAKDCVDEKFAERVGQASYKARQNKLEAFLEELNQVKGKKVPK
jgi:hypothetical protein